MAWKPCAVSNLSEPRLPILMIEVLMLQVATDFCLRRNPGTYIDEEAHCERKVFNLVSEGLLQAIALKHDPSGSLSFGTPPPI